MVAIHHLLGPDERNGFRLLLAQRTKNEFESPVSARDGTYIELGTVFSRLC